MLCIHIMTESDAFQMAGYSVDIVVQIMLLSLKVRKRIKSVALTEQEKAERPFTVQEAADFLKVHINTVKRWIKEGRIKAVKIDRHWRIRRSEIDRVLGEE